MAFWDPTAVSRFEVLGSMTYLVMYKRRSWESKSLHELSVSIGKDLSSFHHLTEHILSRPFFTRTTFHPHSCPESVQGRAKLPLTPLRLHEDMNSNIPIISSMREVS
jgi:hypothetical protein